MDVRDLHRGAVRNAGDLILGTPEDRFAAPTPCADWDVRALIGHMIAGNLLYAHAARGAAPNDFDFSRDFFGDDPMAAFDASAADVHDAFSGDHVLESDFVLPFGAFPAEFAIGLHVVDLVVHAWDLSTATGQETRIDNELLAFGIQHSEIPDEFRGPGMPFGPKVDVPAAALPVDRLVGEMGRDPNWRP